MSVTKILGAGARPHSKDQSFSVLALTWIPLTFDLRISFEHRPPQKAVMGTNFKAEFEFCFHSLPCILEQVNSPSYNTITYKMRIMIDPLKCKCFLMKPIVYAVWQITSTQ